MHVLSAFKMVYCQAFGCRNRSDKGSKCSLFRIPDPLKRPEIAKKWLAAIKVEKYAKASYKFTRNDVLCSDHFTQDCFEPNVLLEAELVPGRIPKKRLKLDAVPSIFDHTTQSKGRESTERRMARTEAREYINQVLTAPTTESIDDQTLQSNIPSTCSSDSAVLSENLQASVQLPDSRRKSDQTIGQTSTTKSNPELAPSSTSMVQSICSHPNRDKCEQMAGIGEEEHTPSFPVEDEHTPSIPMEEEHTPSIPMEEEHTISFPMEELAPSFPVKDHLPLPPKKHSHGTKRKSSSQKDHSPHHLPSLKKHRRVKKRKLSSSKEGKKQTAPCTTSDAGTQTCPEDIPDNGLRDNNTQWPPDFAHINIDHRYTETLLPVLWPCCARNKLNVSTQQSASSSQPSMPMPSPPSPPPAGPQPGQPPTSLPTLPTSPEPPLPELHVQPSPTLTSSISSPESSSSSDDSTDEERSSSSLDMPSSPTSLDSNGRSSDPSFVPSEEESSSDSDTEEEPPQLRFVKDKKFLVFEECLDNLLYAQKCSKCGSGQICEIKKYCVGTMLVVDLLCFCGNTIKWSSQPTIGKQPVGNLLTASAILLSGKTFEQIRFFAELLNLQFISHTTFNTIQTTALLPTINSFYEVNISTLQEEVKDRAQPVILCGDGRCDSPGYNAKYCTYSCIDMMTNKIMDMSLVQVTEATSSVAMEKVGCRRTLDKIVAAGVEVSTMATDRHTGIRKMLRLEYDQIEHQFDVWHLTKSITKRLTKKSKQKDCGDLGIWIKAVTNHIWWAAQHCDKDPVLLIEMIQSLTHHVCNIHQWNSCDKFHKCAHRDLSEEETGARKWLLPGCKAHTALQEVLFDKRLVKDMQQLTQACHTGAIEMYHNLYLKYAPKRLHFKFPAMLGRAQLAVLDHNHNTETKQAVVKHPRRGTALKGSLRYRYVFSKHTKDWIRKKVQEDKDYTYLWEVMIGVLEMRMGDFLPEEPAIPHLPQNIAPVPRPPRAEIDARASTRFAS